MGAWAGFAPFADNRLLLQLDVSAHGASASGIFLGSIDELLPVLEHSKLPKTELRKFRTHSLSSFWEQFTNNDNEVWRWKICGTFVQGMLSNEQMSRMIDWLQHIPVPGMDVTVACMPGGGAVANAASSNCAFPWRHHTMGLQVIARCSC